MKNALFYWVFTSKSFTMIKLLSMKSMSFFMSCA